MQLLLILASCLFLVVEVVFIPVGLWIFVRGKVPSGIFSILFGPGRYKAEPRTAQLFGLLVLVPPSVAFVTFAFALRPLPWLSLVIVSFLIFGGFALVLAKRMRLPEEDESGDDR